VQSEGRYEYKSRRSLSTKTTSERNRHAYVEEIK